jgi:hypothetical protein
MSINGAGWFLWARVGVMLLMTVWLFWEISSPSGDLFAGLSYVMVALLSGIAYIGHLLWTIAMLRKQDDRPSLLGRPMATWLIEPSLFLFAVVCSAKEIPLKARFIINEPALAAYVRTVQTSGVPNTKNPTRVGSYTISETQKSENGEVRMITGPCFIDDCGLIYSPAGRPQEGGENYYRRLRGHWYLWHRSW